MYKFILSVTCLFFGGGLTVLGAESDQGNPVWIVENYIESVYAYCQKYDDALRLYIEGDLLHDPNVRIGNDMDGMANKNYQANWYYINLAKYKISIAYQRQFEIKEFCSPEGSFTGCILKKSVVYPDGKIVYLDELFELEKTAGNSWRIKTISSSLFYHLPDYECQRKSNPDITETPLSNNHCEVFKKAEGALEKGAYEEALQWYVQAKSCAIDVGYVENKINSLNQQLGLEKLIGDADAFYNNGQYEEAIVIYENIALSGAGLSEESLSHVARHIQVCKLEIRYQFLMADADAFFNNHDYEKALSLYEEAYQLKPTDSYLEGRLATCKKLASEANMARLKKEVERATRLLEKGKHDEGFGTLIRNRESGLLNMTHFFYMALVLDNYPKSIQKEFGLAKIDCCILARQFMIKARNLGASSEDFEFVWETHFNKKSRSCLP